MRRRLDAELVRRGLVRSRAEARTALERGLVTVAGRPAGKASTLVGPDEPLRVASASRRFVSRGGEKLAAALDRFGIDPAGREALDAGASTGGFTDVLLQRGVARVIAVDVGYGQLAWPVRTDPRVTVLERTNARSLRSEDLPFLPDLVVADLSFISLALVLPALASVAADGADVICLVKPQFEVGPDRIGRGGVVRDAAAWRDALAGVVDAMGHCGLAPRGVMVSPLRGPAGNVEFFLHAVNGGREAATPDLDAAIAEASREPAGTSEERV